MIYSYYIQRCASTAKGEGGVRIRFQYSSLWQLFDLLLRYTNNRRIKRRGSIINRDRIMRVGSIATHIHNHRQGSG